MTINERVSPETLDKIIEAADEVIRALAGTNEDVHKNDSAKMCQLWDDLNDRYATPAIVKAIARELQQYRAAAEPVAIVEQKLYAAKQLTVTEPVGEVVLGDYDDCGDYPDAKVVCIAAQGQADWSNFRNGTKLYAGPQVTRAPTFDDLRDAVAEMTGGIPQQWTGGDKGHQAVPFMNFNTLGRIVDKFRAAPAVQAEQLSGSSPAIPDGYALVPVEPTDLMVEAMYRHQLSMRGALKAAISAAPKQEAE